MTDPLRGSEPRVVETAFFSLPDRFQGLRLVTVCGSCESHGVWVQFGGWEAEKLCFAKAADSKRFFGGSMAILFRLYRECLYPPTTSCHQPGSPELDTEVPS